LSIIFAGALVPYRLSNSSAALAMIVGMRFAIATRTQMEHPLRKE
jgi:hypothetical protein